MKQWLKDFVHNCVVHPVLPFVPAKLGDWLHDKNADWAFGQIEGKKKPVDKQLAQLLVDDAENSGSISKWLSRSIVNDFPS